MRRHLLAVCVAVLPAQLLLAAPRPPPPPPPPPPPAAAPAKPADAAKPAADAAKPGEAPAADAKPAEKKPVPDTVFESGVKAFNSGNYGKASGDFYAYIQGNEPAARFYDWSEYYLGRSLRAAGLGHAGDEYLYNVAKTRGRAELVPEALRELELDIRAGAFDEDLLVKDLIAGSEYPSAPPEIQAFIQFYQGLADIRDNRLDWADDHFARIPRSSRYSAQATYVLAAQALRRGESEKAEDLFTKAAADPNADLEVSNNAHRSLARILFERKDYVGALKKYDDVKVPFLSEEEASIFLEKAWARYFLKDYRGSLAILISLDAPSYRRAYFPERWILEALIYKSLCHYAASKSSAREFSRRYSDALKAVREQRTPLAHPTIRNAALQAAAPARRFKQLNRLTQERDRLLGFTAPAPLKAHLARMYDLKVKETGRLLEDQLEKEAKRVADELLDFEEQARLVDYEVGLEVFRRVPTAARKAVIPKREDGPAWGSRDVHYIFDGEYWNDELHDYRVSIEDRCFAEGLFQ